MSIRSITLETPDPTAAENFYASAFDGSAFDDSAFDLSAVDVSAQLGCRSSSAPTSGFRGFTLSLVASQPAMVDALTSAALGAGATTVKPLEKSFWGYGGVLRAPDGSIWKVATSSKKNVGTSPGRVDDVVLLLGVEDVKASKRFYVERGLTVKRSFGSKYVEFDAPASHIKLALLGRRALAKDAGVPAEGTGSHRLVIGGNHESFTDPDDFAWRGSTA